MEVGEGLEGKNSGASRSKRRYERVMGSAYACNTHVHTYGIVKKKKLMIKMPIR